MIGLKVPKNNANDIRIVLIGAKLLNLDYKIYQENDFVYLPLIDDSKLKELNIDYEVVDVEFNKHKTSPKSFMDFLEGKIDGEKIDKIKTSFDIIGDVVILEIPDELYDYRFDIGKAALNFTKRKSVFMKKSEIKGVIRVRDMELIAGLDISETIHKEYGSKICLDVRKVYFSPRLATERKRIMDEVVDGEVILDMFTGAGPFVVDICRNRDVFIYAVDINPDAIYYLKKNIQINKLEGMVEPLLGDAREVLSKKDLKVDRVLMNLPGLAYEFLDLAIELVKPGGIINYYEFSSDFETPIQHIINAAGHRHVEILNKRHVKSRSPGVWHIAIDACIN